MNFTLIIPACGLSSRFGGQTKWLLKDNNNKTMLEKSIEGINKTNFSKIIIVVLDKTFKTNNLPEIKNAQYFTLDKQTKSQSETIYTAIKKLKIEGAIAVKDSDSSFNCTPLPINAVAVSKPSANKSNSFVKIESGLITTIAEKEPVSDTFCVGLYSFENAAAFCLAYELVKLGQYMLPGKVHEEVYVSDVIRKMLQLNIFLPLATSNYKSYNTPYDWEVNK